MLIQLVDRSKQQGMRVVLLRRCLVSTVIAGSFPANCEHEFARFFTEESCRTPAPTASLASRISRIVMTIPKVHNERCQALFGSKNSRIRIAVRWSFLLTEWSILCYLLCRTKVRGLKGQSPMHRRQVDHWRNAPFFHFHPNFPANSASVKGMLSSQIRFFNSAQHCGFA